MLMRSRYILGRLSRGFSGAPTRLQWTFRLMLYGDMQARLSYRRVMHDRRRLAFEEVEAHGPSMSISHFACLMEIERHE